VEMRNSIKIYRSAAVILFCA